MSKEYTLEIGLSSSELEIVSREVVGNIGRRK